MFSALVCVCVCVSISARALAYVYARFHQCEYHVWSCARAQSVVWRGWGATSTIVSVTERQVTTTLSL